MHDAKGRELKIGDTVLIPAIITELYATEEYCNVGVETVFGRRPDGKKERISAINTGVMLRNNIGDQNDILSGCGCPEDDKPCNCTESNNE